MRLTLVRHTAVAVAPGICYGQRDVELAMSFADEWREIGRQIDATRFDRVYSSPLSRCARLAAVIVGAEAVTFDERLRELHFGDWEMADWDSVFASAAGKAWFADYVNAHCPNGEAFTDQIARMRAFFAELRARGDAEVLAFTHAGNLRAAMCLLAGKTPVEAFTTPVAYGQILTLEIDEYES